MNSCKMKRDERDDLKKKILIKSKIKNIKYISY